MESQGSQERNQGRQRTPIATSGPWLTFDLNEEVRRLEAEQPWQAEHTANTIVKYPDLRIVLVALKTGGRLNEHRTTGRISIQTIHGKIRVHVEQQSVELAAGQLLSLDYQVAHEVEAIADSVFLLTIAWTSKEVEKHNADSR